MPRFHFHQANGRDYPDEEGTELPGLDDARRVALLAFTEMVRNHGPEFWGAGAWRMTVTDGEGLTLFVLELTALSAPAIAALPPRGPASGPG